MVLVLTSLLIMLTQSVEAQYYTVDEIERCYALIPKGHVIGPDNEIFDMNGSPTNLSCKDFLNKSAETVDPVSYK